MWEVREKLGEQTNKRISEGGKIKAQGNKFALNFHLTEAILRVCV